MPIATNSIKSIANRLSRYLFFIIVILLCLLTNTWADKNNKLRIELTGVNEESKTSIMTSLIAEQESYSGNLASQTFLVHATETIRSALQVLGYFNPNIQSNLKYTRAQQPIMHFFIQPGLPVLITRIDLQIAGPGQDNPAIQNAIRQFPLRPGQILNTERYEKAKSNLFDVINNQGYLKATLDKKELRIDLKNHSAVVILHLNTGQQYYFGAISFNSNPFDPTFLHRFISFKENEPFSSDKLLKLQEDLNGSKYFKQVTVSPQLDQAKNFKVPTQIDLTAPKSQFYSMGVGYGTYTGPRITLGVDFRRVTNTGQHFNAQVKYSSVLKGLAAKYFIPGKNPLTEQYTLGANVQEFIPKNGKSFSETLSGSYVKTLGNWTNTLSLNLLNEHYSETNKPSTSSHLLYPSYNMSNINVDNMIYPTFGNAFNVTVQGSNEEIFSTTSFVQGEIKDKFIFSPTKTSRIVLRGDLGYTIVNDLKQLPLTLNYFAGGLNSVRGYAYSSLGPGRYLEVASAEFQKKIYGNWNGALFYDVGNATDHFNDTLMRGIGIGIIYHSIIGAVQIYVARAESKRDKPLSIEFTIGPDF